MALTAIGEVPQWRRGSWLKQLPNNSYLSIYSKLKSADSFTWTIRHRFRILNAATVLLYDWMYISHRMQTVPSPFSERCEGKKKSFYQVKAQLPTNLTGERYSQTLSIICLAASGNAELIPWALCSISIIIMRYEHAKLCTYGSKGCQPPLPLPLSPWQQIEIIWNK